MGTFSYGITSSIALAAFIPVFALAQNAGNYPSKPVRVVSVLGSGGAVDSAGRMVSAKLSENFQTQFFVDIRSGAGGTIGYTYAAKAAPDGYTLLVAGSGYTIVPALYAVQYDPLKDLVPIGQINQTTYLLATHPSLPVKSVKDLVALAKSKPGAINYASGGVGSSIHFAMELFAISAGGIKFNHIAYSKGTGQAQIELLSGEIQSMMTNLISSLSYVKSGRLRGLGISSSHRSALLPEIPTIAEAGVPGYSRTGWIGFFAPSATPPEILKKLSTEIALIAKDPVITKRILESGGEPPDSLEQFRLVVKNELEANRKIAAQANIKIN